MRWFIVEIISHLFIVCETNGSISRLMGKKTHELKYTEHNDITILIWDAWIQFIKTKHCM